LTTDEPWTVRLTALAEADFRGIVEWTVENFGDRQALVYAQTLLAALEKLTSGPAAVGVRERQEISQGIRTLHVGSASRPGRHIIVFRLAAEGRATRAIEVLRLLHEAMDLEQHISGQE
jgi:toxin ParE1/3/4